MIQIFEQKASNISKDLRRSEMFFRIVSHSTTKINIITICIFYIIIRIVQGGQQTNYNMAHGLHYPFSA